jgi:hypothetical protein
VAGAGGPPERVPGHREGFPRPSPSGVPRTLREWRSFARTIIARYPLLYLPIARLRGQRGVITRDTGFVIEGYPRSGNTFATAAFGMAKSGPQPRVAHHTHAAAVVIAAIRRGIPVLLLIRRPEDAVLSVAIRQPDLSLRAALRAYVGFYGPLLRYRDDLVVATFEDVVRDFGAVTRRVNERFGTSFGVFEHTPGNVRKALALIETEEADRYGSGRNLQERAAFPSEERARLKERLRAGDRWDELRTLRARAERMYEVFTGGSPA